VKLLVTALDYDGTIARGDVLDPSVRKAIAAARTGGIVVLLVTGRILTELQRVAGDLHFVDGVIAENGAVMHFPESGRTSTLAPTVPDGFLVELRRRRIPFTAGQCLIDVDANEAPRLLDVIRTLELPLVLIFNGGRVMVAAQGVSKASGLRVAVETLRLSARNVGGRRRRERSGAPANRRSRRRRRMGQQELAGQRRRRSQRQRTSGDWLNTFGGTTSRAG